MSIKSIFSCISSALFSCLLFCGCSGDNLEPVYPVTGTVTAKGKPVEGAIVAFTPVKPGVGIAASAITDSSGVYKLSTRASNDGAAAGQYSVTIAKYDKKLPPKKEKDAEPKADATTEAAANAEPYDVTNPYPPGYNEMTEAEIAASIAKNVLPAKYASTASSNLTAEVKNGTNTFDFKVD
jgi:hypothetical protein